MIEYRTKYFGNIFIDETGEFESIDLKYKDKEIRISLYKCNVFGNKSKNCLEMIDKYIEINEIAKKAILENYSKNKIIEDYFRDHFEDYSFEEEKIVEIFGVNTFSDFNAKKTIEELEYPNLLFSMEENNEIKISVDYQVSKKYSDEILCVKIDEKLNIIEFTHES